jgi:hypothetical protein
VVEMDVSSLAEFYITLWGGALSTLGLVGVAKWIWHVIATSTEETVVEKKTLKELEKEGA